MLLRASSQAGGLLLLSCGRGTVPVCQHVRTALISAWRTNFSTSGKNGISSSQRSSSGASFFMKDVTLQQLAEVHPELEEFVAKSHRESLAQRAQHALDEKSLKEQGERLDARKLASLECLPEAEVDNIIHDCKLGTFSSRDEAIKRIHELVLRSSRALMQPVAEEVEVAGESAPAAPSVSSASTALDAMFQTELRLRLERERARARVKPVEHTQPRGMPGMTPSAVQDPWAPLPGVKEARASVKPQVSRVLHKVGYINKDPSLLSSLKLLRLEHLAEILEDCGLPAFGRRDDLAERVFALMQDPNAIPDPSITYAVPPGLQQAVQALSSPPSPSNTNINVDQQDLGSSHDSAKSMNVHASGAHVSDSVSSIPSHPSSIPNHTSSIPNHASSIPNHTSSIPNHASSIPNHTSSIPNHASSIPNHTSSIPNHASSIPNHASSIPNHASSIPNHASSIPNHTSSIPNHASSIPNHISSIPNHPSSIPNHTSSIPDRALFRQPSTSGPTGRHQSYDGSPQPEGIAATDITSSIPQTIGISKLRSDWSDVEDTAAGDITARLHRWDLAGDRHHASLGADPSVSFGPQGVESPASVPTNTSGQDLHHSSTSDPESASIPTNANGQGHQQSSATAAHASFIPASAGVLDESSTVVDSSPIPPTTTIEAVNHLSIAEDSSPIPATTTIEAVDHLSTAEDSSPIPATTTTKAVDQSSPADSPLTPAVDRPALAQPAVSYQLHAKDTHPSHPSTSSPLVPEGVNDLDHQSPGPVSTPAPHSHLNATRSPASYRALREIVLWRQQQRQSIQSMVEDPDLISHWLVKAKAQDVCCIDLRHRAGYADWMIIGTGLSQQHVAACVQGVRHQIGEKLAGLGKEVVTELGLHAPDVVGPPVSDWVALHVGSCVVHVFTHRARRFYDLEGLWGRSGTVRWLDDGESLMTVDTITAEDEVREQGVKAGVWDEDGLRVGAGVGVGSRGDDGAAGELAAVSVRGSGRRRVPPLPRSQ